MHSAVEVPAERQYDKHLGPHTAHFSSVRVEREHRWWRDSIIIIRRISIGVSTDPIVVCAEFDALTCARTIVIPTKDFSRSVYVYSTCFHPRRYTAYDITHSWA